MPSLRKAILLNLAAITFGPVLFAGVTLPSSDSPEGFIAHLLINESPFPGERTYRSEDDTMRSMESILNVLVSRLLFVPVPYRQTDVAAVRTDNILDIITAGGVRGQVDGFYRDSNGRLTMVSRVTERTDNLLRIANTGQPGRFARLINHAVAISTDYTRKATIPYDPYARLAVIERISITGRAYSWMTDQSYYHPGGNFVRIPDSHKGALGGNRFFSLRSKPR
jgi:hypothetical protein